MEAVRRNANGFTCVDESSGKAEGKKYIPSNSPLDPALYMALRRSNDGHIYVTDVKSFARVAVQRGCAMK